MDPKLTKIKPGQNFYDYGSLIKVTGITLFTSWARMLNVISDNHAETSCTCACSDVTRDNQPETHGKVLTFGEHANTIQNFVFSLYIFFLLCSQKQSHQSWKILSALTTEY